MASYLTSVRLTILRNVYWNRQSNKYVKHFSLCQNVLQCPKLQFLKVFMLIGYWQEHKHIAICNKCWCSHRNLSDCIFISHFNVIQIFDRLSLWKILQYRQHIHSFQLSLFYMIRLPYLQFFWEKGKGEEVECPFG